MNGMANDPQYYARIVRWMSLILIALHMTVLFGISPLSGYPDIISILSIVGYACITYLLIPIITLLISTRKKINPDVKFLIPGLIIYATCYLSFWFYLHSGDKDALGMGFMAMLGPWVVNVAILIAFALYFLIDSAIKKVRSKK